MLNTDNSNRIMSVAMFDFQTSEVDYLNIQCYLIAVVHRRSFMKTHERLRNARLRIGITQEYVARELNIPRTAVVQMENGTRRVSSEELAALCDIYGVSADYVIGREKDNSPLKSIARSFESLSEEDQREIVSLIEFKKEMAERRKRMQTPED